MKANNHPLVRDLRRILDRYDIDAVILVGVKKDGYPIVASAGSDVAKCDAVGELIDSDTVDILKYEIDIALINRDQMELFE